MRGVGRVETSLSLRPTVGLGLRPSTASTLRSLVGHGRILLERAQSPPMKAERSASLSLMVNPRCWLRALN